MIRCPYLAYSKVENGLFCHPCALFGPPSESGGKGGQKLKSLVTQPLQNYGRLFGKDRYLTELEKGQYHKTAVARTQEFLEMINKRSDFAKEIDSAHKLQALENRKRLARIVKTLILCGKLNIPLRGHRDNGALDVDDCDASIPAESGNFRSLLAFRVDAGDSDLKAHLESSGKNAIYISKTSQI